MSSDQVNLASLKIRREPEQSSAKSSSSRNKKIIYIIGAVVIIVVLIFLVKGLFSSVPKVETSVVTLVYPSQTNQVLVASGYVVAQRKAAVASKGTGRLEKLFVVEGDPVKKNDIIAQIESADIEAALSQAKANLEMGKALLQQAKAELTDAANNYERAKNLIKEGSISQSEFDMAEARFRRGTAMVASAEASVRAYGFGVRSAEVQLENMRIRAPFDGTVLTKNADVGEVVAPFGASLNARGAVVTIADMNSLEVEADVSESNIQKIKVDQPCEITLDAFPEKRYRGIVHKIVPTVDRAKATVMTKVQFIDRDNRVLPEMSAKVAFLTEAMTENDANQKMKLGLNPSAIISRNGIKYVFVVKDNILSLQQVTLGASIGSAIEVLSGLSAGEKVVIKPLESLSDGTKVITE